MTLWTVSVRRLQHNLYAYYGLNPLFKTAVVNGQKLILDPYSLESFLYSITTKASIVSEEYYLLKFQ
jgi:hypothetical protein